MTKSPTPSAEMQENVDFSPELKALISKVNSLPLFSPVRKAIMPLTRRLIEIELPYVVSSAFHKGLHD